MTRRAGRPLRVVYLIGYPADLTGSQRSLLALVEAMRSRDVLPLAVFPGEGRCTSAFRDAGITVEVLPAPAPLARYGGVIPTASLGRKVALAARQLPGYARRFAALLARERADVAHFNDIRALLLAGGGALLRRTPRIWHVRGDGSALGAAWGVGAALAHRMICVADAVRDVMPAWSRARCRTVYNGIDDELEVATRSRASLLAATVPPIEERDGDLLVVMVASLVPFKGAHHLVEAAMELESRAPTLASRLVLVHVGDAPDRPYRAHVLERASRLSRVRIRFVGWDPRPLDWMRAADVVVLPTVDRETLPLDGRKVLVHGNEGFPRTVLEAMTCARTVVATRVMGIPEQVVHGETGLLCDPSDPKDLARALERILLVSAEERLRMGAAGRERVRERFSTERAVAGTMAVYRELVG